MEPTEPTTPSIKLPGNIAVTVKTGSILAIAYVICSLVLAWAWVAAKGEAKSISVTGSAKKSIKSDMIGWHCTLSVRAPDLKGGFVQLRQSTDKALGVIRKDLGLLAPDGSPKDVAGTSIQTSSVDIAKRYKKDTKGNDTNTIENYDLTQTVTVWSDRLEPVDELSKRITNLIEEGIDISSGGPTFLYTKLADLKIEMLAAATRDAQTRADQIARNSGGKLGAVQQAKMGVMQINAANSTDVSDSGNNDTSSLWKDVTAVVNARFEVK